MAIAYFRRQSQWVLSNGEIKLRRGKPKKVGEKNLLHYHFVPHQTNSMDLTPS
jgi:hypothetical protein